MTAPSTSWTGAISGQEPCPLFGPIWVDQPDACTRSVRSELLNSICGIATDTATTPANVAAMVTAIGPRFPVAPDLPAIMTPTATAIAAWIRHSLALHVRQYQCHTSLRDDE